MASRNTYPRPVPGYNRFRQAVAIDSPRILDSCADKECLEDLQVFFCAKDQAVIESSVQVKNAAVTLENVTFEIEPVHLRAGSYAVDLTLLFNVAMLACDSRQREPVRVTGHTYYQKRCVLYGGESTVRTFYSDGAATQAMPKACVQACEPVTLNARLTGAPLSYKEPPAALPFQLDRAGGDTRAQKTVLVSIGIFTITALEKPAQLLIPVYDYAVPDKECRSSNPCDGDPCAMFRDIRFPSEQFYPNP